MMELSRRGAARALVDFVAAVALCSVGCAQTSSSERDTRDIQQVLTKYLRSVNAADPKLGSEVWLQAPDILVVTPFGRFQGWDAVRQGIYVNFLQKAFSERSVQATQISIRVVGDTAWAVFNWTFKGKLANGQSITTEGWESHGYQRTSQGWRIVHLHYSVPPPRPPSY